MPTSPSRGRASCATWWRGSRSAAGRPGPRRSCAAPTSSGSATTTCRPETPLSELYGFLGPRADLLVTQGADGGLLIRLGPDGPVESLRYLPTATDGESDPTGAGDTFLAALQASILRPAVVGRTGPATGSTCASPRRPGRSSWKGRASDGVPDRAAVLVRRARERIRRAVIPTEVSQVGAVEAP